MKMLKQMNFLKSMPLTLLLCFFSGQLLAQEKEDFKNKMVCFIIKSHVYQSQIVADSLLNVEKKLLDEFKSGKSLFPPPPPARLAMAYDEKHVDYLLVSSEKLIFQYMPRFLTGKDGHQKYVNLKALGYINISRDSLTQNTRNLMSDVFDRKKPIPIRYEEKESFPIVSENRDVVRTINGFKCHQIIMKDDLSGTGNLIEMFITEEIRLEYHPFLKVKEYLDRFFPLYIRSYDPNFPIESYEEYNYEMYEIAF